MNLNAQEASEKPHHVSSQTGIFLNHALLYWPHFVQVQVNIQGLVMDSAIFEILHSDGDTWGSQMWRLIIYTVTIKNGYKMENLSETNPRQACSHRNLQVMAF